MNLIKNKHKICKSQALLSAIVLFVSHVWIGSLAWGNNIGLGPLRIGEQFQPWQQFLKYTPTSPQTLPPGVLEISYQHALTNSFINTQTPRLAQAKPKIDDEARKRGLTVHDFPKSGYGMFLDVESHRSAVRIGYGLLPNLEVGLEYTWHSFGGGSLDHNIERVEHIFSSINRSRTLIERDQYQIFIVRDRKPLAVGKKPFQRVAGEPTGRIKWQVGVGDAFWPAVGIELAYKHPRKADSQSAEALVNSGGKDYGLTLLLSKQTGVLWGKPMIIHAQAAQHWYEVPAYSYRNRRWHLMLGGELRITANQSMIAQTTIQNSLFGKGTSNQYLASNTYLITVGYQLQALPWLFELGFIEDYYQQFNELDITGYVQVGWRW